MGRPVWRWLTFAAPNSGTTLYLVHTVGVSSAALGACLELARMLPGFVVLPLAAVGSMTSTLYGLHVLALDEESP